MLLVFFQIELEGDNTLFKGNVKNYVPTCRQLAGLEDNNTGYQFATDLDLMGVLSQQVLGTAITIKQNTSTTEPTAIGSTTTNATSTTNHSNQGHSSAYHNIHISTAPSPVPHVPPPPPPPTAHVPQPPTSAQGPPGSTTAPPVPQNDQKKTSMLCNKRSWDGL